MNLNKEELIEFKELRQQAEEVAIKLASGIAKVREVFENDNKDLYELQHEIRAKLSDQEVVLRKHALLDFEETGEKKLLGGLGIQERTKLEYNPSAAMEWAREKMPVCIKEVFDKKPFEVFAKGNKYTEGDVEVFGIKGLAELKKVPSATIPSEITLE